MLRLRGGGTPTGPALKACEMGIAPGGLIKQCILEDHYPASMWKRDESICFNIQILNSELFRQVTDMEPPPTPISAKTYAEHGLPYFEIYNETSNIKGDFEGVKSIKTIDKAKANAAPEEIHVKRKREDHDEKMHKNPVISLNSDGTKRAFRPVSELKRDLLAVKNV